MKKYKLTVAQLLMLQRIYAFATDPDNVSITNSVSALSNSFTLLHSKTVTVEQWLAQYSVIIKGLTAQKRQAKRDLADYSYTILRAVYAFAVDTGNNDLKAEVRISLSRLRYMPYHSLLSYITGAIAVVQPYVGSLTGYNVDGGKMNTWQNLLNAYATILNIPQSAIRDHKTLGQNIDILIYEAMEFTRNTIDGLVSSLMTSQNAYYRGYFNQRIVIETGIHHTRAVVTVVNELGEPFVGATVTVDQLTKVVDPDTGRTRTFKAVRRTTDIDGRAEVEKFEQGNRTVTVSGDGIVTKTFGPWYFEHGKAVVRLLTCQPDFNNLPPSKSTKQKEKDTK